MTTPVLPYARILFVGPDLAEGSFAELLRQRLAELRVLEKELRGLRGRCDGQADHCQVIEALHERAEAQDLPPQPSASALRHV